MSHPQGNEEKLADVAQHSLLIALAVDDPITLKSASFATRRGITLDIRGNNIMGVPVPIIDKKRFVKGLMERGYSILGMSGRIDKGPEKSRSETGSHYQSRRDRDVAPANRQRDPDDPPKGECPGAGAHLRTETPGKIYRDHC